MKTKIIVALAVILILTVVILVGMPSQKKEIIHARFSLSNKTGFDLSPDVLSFGEITANQSASRSITLRNTENKSVKIQIKSSGEISDNIIASENNFYLEPGESKIITFSIFADGLTEFREYDGDVIILTKQ